MSDMFHEKFDVCVIGSGAGGAPVAACCAQKGLRVALLERGRLLVPRDMEKDEYAVCRQPLFHPDQRAGAREIFYGNTRIEGNHLWTATCVGGGTRIMSGYFFRMQEHDFLPRSTFGTVAGATHQDWPIRYADLDTYYDRVASDCGISGNPAMGDQCVKPSSMPLKAHPVSALIDKGCSALGYRSFPTPRAVLSAKRGDREACSYSGLCGSYGCLTGAKASTHETYIKTAVATGNCVLLPGYYVYRLEAHRDRVIAAHYFDEESIPSTIHADVFVVACGAIETARLLLNSATPAFSSGLANSSGHVGKNLTFTMPCEVTGLFPVGLFSAPADADSPFVQRCTQDFCVLDTPEMVYKRGGTVVFLFPHPNPINRMVALSYDEQGRRVIGNKLKDRARHFFSFNHVQSDGFIDFLPNENTSVSISRSVRDVWNVPSARVSVFPHPENIKASQIVAGKISEVFRSMGALHTAYNPSPFTAGELQHGTCRFGVDPKTTVLNPDCRSHDVANLYITDGSFMPSGLPVPSTYTIIANALRVAEKIYAHG